jgi:hypothetical protein
MVAGWLDPLGVAEPGVRAGAVDTVGREITPEEDGLAGTRGDSRKPVWGRAGAAVAGIDAELLRAGIPPPTDGVRVRSERLPGRVDGSTALPPGTRAEPPEGVGRPATAGGRPGVSDALPREEPEPLEPGRAGTMPEAAEEGAMPDFRDSCRARIVEGGVASRPAVGSIRGR